MNIKMMKRITYVLLTLLLMAMLSGCSLNPFDVKNQENETSKEISDDNLIVVGISQLGSESAWRSAHTISVQNAFTKDKGYFMIFNNARQKQENQIKAIRSFISQRVDYIVFAPVIEDGWDTVLREAKDAGIPVILMDRTISVADESLYTTRVGIDARQEGEKAGKWLESELIKKNRQNDDINIVVIQGTTGSSSQRGRTIGFDSICDEHENWNILTQVDGDFTTLKGKEAMQQILKLYKGDFDVLVCQNDDMALGALEALNEEGIKTGIGKDIMLISFDATHDGLELVRDGVINVDVECNPEQGEYISDVIQKLERGEKVEKEYLVDEKVFTINNVNEYIDNRTY